MTTTKIAILKDLTDPDKIDTFERDNDEPHAQGDRVPDCRLEP